MDREQRPCKQFPGYNQVAQVGAGEGAAGVAVAAFIDRAPVPGKAGIHQVQPALGGEGGIVPRQAGGQDAIEDIHAAGNAVDQVLGSANAHQVTRF